MIYSFDTFVAFGSRFSVNVNVYRGGFRLHTFSVDVPLSGVSSYDLVYDANQAIEQELDSLSAFIKKSFDDQELPVHDLAALVSLKDKLVLGLDEEYGSTTLVSYILNINSLNRLTLEI
jgi:hypothetical protein